MTDGRKDANTASAVLSAVSPVVPTACGADALSASLGIGGAGSGTTPAVACDRSALLGASLASTPYWQKIWPTLMSRPRPIVGKYASP